MNKDRELIKFLNDWANDDDEVQKKMQMIFDKDLQKALKAWERSGALKFSKAKFKSMSKAKFNKALAKLKANYKPGTAWAKYTKYDL